MIYLKTKKLPLIIASIIISIIFLGFIPTTNTGSSAFFIDNENQDPAVVIGMTNTMKFTLDTVHIKKGQTVKWNNSSLLAHSVTGDPAKSTIKGSAQLPDGAKPFDSGMLDPEQTFKHTFKKAGTYQYFCIPHEGTKMYGWVVVKT